MPISYHLHTYNPTVNMVLLLILLLLLLWLRYNLESRLSFRVLPLYFLFHLCLTPPQSSHSFKIYRTSYDIYVNIYFCLYMCILVNTSKILQINIVKSLFRNSFWVHGVSTRISHVSNVTWLWIYGKVWQNLIKK